MPEQLPSVAALSRPCTAMPSEAGPSVAYRAFINKKSQLGGQSGFAPIRLHDFLFDFQKALVEWAVRKGRAATFADTGLGKTAIQLAWADNVVRKENRPVLILTPLVVGSQTVREGEKFGIDCTRSRDGTMPAGEKVVVTNYEQLHRFDCTDFAGVVCDESGILKSFDGTRRTEITEFMRRTPYRLLCTATPSPNDFTELGTSAEALGELGHMDMLSQFFKNDTKTLHPLGTKHGDFSKVKWWFKPHAERHFWRWVCSWARACRKPSDLGFDDGRFVLPELVMRESVVKASRKAAGMLFELPAQTMDEVREEQRRTIAERCEAVTAMIAAEPNEPAIAWCQLNEEGNLLEKSIPGAVQVSGSDPDEKKEEAFTAFVAGQVRVIVTKPKIAAWGLNLQHCARMTFFPSYSFEQFYQSVRRCWRFGQTRKVRVDIVTTEGGAGALASLKRKQEAADRMFGELVELMNDATGIRRSTYGSTEAQVPAWL